MRKRSLYILLCCTFFVNTSFKTHSGIDNLINSKAKDHSFLYDIPQDFFSSPVNRDLKLSGTFGELRANHFHAGLDIKPSAGVPGDPIFAAGEGFISRIRIDPTGYGNLLMIQHPNGLTSLYAHLQKFTPEITEYMYAQLSSLQTYDVDIRVPSTVFPVKSGSPIAFMGNTGASNGAHLHFEIRETTTDMAINPLMFKLPITDKIQPWMNSIKAYSINDDLECTKELLLPLVKVRNGTYKISRDTLMLGSDRIGFAVSTFDSHDGNWNRNGVYSIKMYVDEVLKYQFNMDSIYFEESRYCNAHMDYSEKVRRNSYFHRCYALPGNKLPIYSVNQGIVPISTDKAQKIRIESGDHFGNVSKTEFYVKRGTMDDPGQPCKKFEYKVAYDRPQYIDKEDASFHFSQGTLYDDAFIDLQRQQDPLLTPYSGVYKIGDPYTPLHQGLEIAFKRPEIPQDRRSNAYVAEIRSQPIPVFCGNVWSGDSLIGKSKNFGTFCVKIDSIGPKIRPIIFGANMTKSSVMAFNMSDNVKYPSKVKGIKYEVRIDGQWVFMSYDPSNGSLKMPLKTGQYTGTHALRIEASDLAGNTTVFESNFSR